MNMDATAILSAEGADRRTSSISPDAAEFLSGLRGATAAPTWPTALEKIRTTLVLYIGETIIDEYQYCESLGKSGKEPVLAVRYVSDEKFAGGVLATANQSAAFCENVGLLTLLGENDSHTEFVRAKLNSNIDASFLPMPATRTIVKRRMVETYPFQKLFEVYFMDLEVPETASRCLVRPAAGRAARLRRGGGHRLRPRHVDARNHRVCCARAIVSWRSTHRPTRPTRASTARQNTAAPILFAFRKRSLRLEVRHRTKDLQLIAAETAERMACEQMVITRGRSGSLCYHVRDGFFSVPSFTARIVRPHRCGRRAAGRGFPLPPRACRSISRASSATPLGHARSKRWAIAASSCAKIYGGKSTN